MCVVFGWFQVTHALEPGWWRLWRHFLNHFLSLRVVNQYREEAGAICLRSIDAQVIP